MDYYSKMLPVGLTYIPNVLSVDEQTEVIRFCFAQGWDDTLKRKTQQYGYRYDYGGGPLTRCEEIPVPIMELFLNQIKRGNSNLAELAVKSLPDQVIVNHYEPGQGISAHSDDYRRFGDTIVIFSLMHPVCMNFTHDTHSPVELLLESGSILIMQGESRYNWKHEIKPRMSDVINGKRTRRNVRISVTFRWVK